MLTAEDIRRAASRLECLVTRTPLLPAPALNDRLSLELLLKAENLQRGGSFKFRGALNAISTLSPEARQAGVVASSSGNHGLAIALAASILKVSAVVVMPSDAPKTKLEAAAAAGARIVIFERRTQDREEIAQRLAREEGRTYIPAYDHYGVMAGQGTVALEILQQGPPPDVIVVPVSGGGLIAGCATIVRALSPKTEVWGAEPETADDTRRSLEIGQRVEHGGTETIADGLRARSPGALTFPINQKLVAGVLTVSDDEIANAMRLCLKELKLVVEASGACALAAALKHAEMFRGKRVAVVLSGGNIDLDVLEQILREHN